MDVFFRRLSQKAFFTHIVRSVHMRYYKVNDPFSIMRIHKQFNVIESFFNDLITLNEIFYD